MEIQNEKINKEYIPIYFDALFYKVFGEEKRIDALKYIIEQILNVKVKSIRILNGKILGNKFRTKRSYLDLLVILNDDTKLSIEINTDTSNIVMERNLIFIFKVMANDVKIENKYSDLSNFIQINLNSEKSKNAYSFEKYVLMEEKSHKLLTDKLQILKINLSFYANKCYTSSELNELSDFEKLMGLIGAKTQKEYDIFSSEEGMLKDIMDAADKYRDDSDIIEMYDRETEMNRIYELEKKQAIKDVIDEKDRIFELEKREAIKEAIDEKERIYQLEKRKAIKEAIDENTNKITKQNSKAIALNFLNKGIDLDIIADATGLSMNEINELMNGKK